ncbi:S-adenosyl-L-methionine-dependent methyltransferase [Aulographum hederae CBS 113979]|uniref:Protein-lysine N-methyltransferase EFM4 n=1 Tax=Aulographum hederae CBS 113979 TaxID=1176131 RepID=A0A6G1H0U2_9PEZI|nr:S-adenosyl-L-methionine-dependent methyltransferase [Aulographum hederae CBS 113979]
MTTTSKVEHLAPSELGTKEYWDEAYTRELANHSTSSGSADPDEGTIWFSDADAEEKIIDFLDDLAEDGVLIKSNSDPSATVIDATAPPNPSTILDLGTGNGHMLFALRDAGWTGRMVGVDYSAASVELAKQIAASRSSISPETGHIAFHEWNILTSAAGSWLPADSSGLNGDGDGGAGFDVLLDKGTFDAISLSPALDSAGRRVCESYSEKVAPLVKKGGLFVLTSCNWTEEELRRWFEGAGEEGRLEFVFRDRVRYPSFSFGGKSGQKVVSVCFERR